MPFGCVSFLVRKALAQISFEASPIEVTNALKLIMPTVGLSLKEETINETPYKAELHCKRGMSMLSWGEKISIRITGDDHGGSNIQANSTSVYRPTVLDYGQNKKNLQRVMDELSKKYKNTSPLSLKERIW
jgi:hypothetical protein